MNRDNIIAFILFGCFLAIIPVQMGVTAARKAFLSQSRSSSTIVTTKWSH